jgi:formyl-CoA transferase
MSLNGAIDGPPTKAPTFLADDLAGLHAALGALAALRHRDQTGEGQHVDVCLLDALLFQSNGLLSLGAAGMDIPRLGSETMASVPTNTFQCQDGYVYLAMILDRHFAALCHLMGRDDLPATPGFRTNAERVANRDGVNELVAAWCAGLPTDAVMEMVVGAGIAAARVNSFADAARTDHVEVREMLQTVELANGTTAALTGPAAKFSRTPTRVRNAAPRAGAHTAEVLAELGIGDEELGRLRAEGIV